MVLRGEVCFFFKHFFLKDQTLKKSESCGEHHTVFTVLKFVLHCVDFEILLCHVLATLWSVYRPRDGFGFHVTIIAQITYELVSRPIGITIQLWSEITIKLTAIVLFLNLNVLELRKTPNNFLNTFEDLKAR